MLVSPLRVRVGTATSWVVVHGPWGCGATETRTVPPAHSSSFTTDTHVLPKRRGCIAFARPGVSAMGAAAARSFVHVVPSQYCGVVSKRPLATRARNT